MGEALEKLKGGHGPPFLVQDPSGTVLIPLGAGCFSAMSLYP